MKDLTELHLWDYLGVILSRKHVALSILLAGIALAALYTFTRKPKFQATSRILIENQAVNLTEMDEALAQSNNRPLDREFIPTQLRILKSRPVIEDALRKTGLLQKKEFSEAPDPISRLQEQITVSRERSARLAKVSTLRQDPEEAAQIVNAVVDAFKRNSRQRRLGISSEGLLELKKKAEELRIKLDRKTQVTRDFMKEHDIISFDHSQKVESDRHRALSESIARVEPVRLSLKAKVYGSEQALKKGAAIDALPDVLESRIIVELKLELARQGMAYADLQRRYGEKHPEIQGLDMQMSSLRAQIGLIAQSILTSLKAQYETAESEVEYLKTELQIQEQKVATFSELAYEYNILVKDKLSTEQAFDQINRRIEELQLTDVPGQGDTIFVISKAEVPQKNSWPSHPKNLLFGAFAGLVIAVTTCFFLEYMDTTVKTPQDIKETLNCEVIGTLPRIETTGSTNHDLDVLENPRGQLAEAIKIIRAALTFGQGKAIHHFAVTSTFPEEGKTLVTASLAISFAQTDKRVLLVDADLRKPRMHKVFNIENQRGLADLLTQDQPFEAVEQCLHPTQVPHLDFLPAGSLLENPAERLNSSEFEEFVKRAKARYDVVIFDSPPCLSIVDAMIISKHLDGIIPVVRTFRTQRKALSAFASTLQNAQVPLIGAVANQVDAPKAGKYSGHYGYGYGYGQYGPYGGSPQEPAT